MTDNGLPQRHFIELPAPPQGEAVAVREGRGMRRRRRVAGTGAAALSVALVAGIAVAAGTTSNRADEQLVPAVPGLHRATPAPSVDTAPPAVAAGGSAPARSGTAPGSGPVAQTAAQRSPSARPASPPAGSGRDSRPTSYTTPALRRSYTPPDPTGARICGAQITDGGSGTHKRIDWCLTAAANRTGAGHDLSIAVCRDQTADATLSFAGSREADLAVVRNGRVVWRWSVGHPSAAQPHALATPAGACWTWTAPWTDVDAAGRPLPSGSYSLQVVSLAHEVADLPDQSSTFTVD